MITIDEISKRIEIQKELTELSIKYCELKNIKFKRTLENKDSEEEFGKETLLIELRKLSDENLPADISLNDRLKWCVQEMKNRIKELSI